MIDSSQHRIVAVPARGLISGQRVGLAAGLNPGPALLTVDNGRRAAVVVHQLREAPPGVLAVGEDLRDLYGLTPDSRWTLEQVPATDLDRIVLELSTERDPEPVARDLAADLAGRVLWLPGGDTDVWLDVADVPFRVLDAGPHRGVIGRIHPRTTVELYAPGVKAGVDIVILADCSHSMETDDIPVETERATGWARFSQPRQQYIKRIDALRRALDDLLRVRLQVSGRISRVALLGFNAQTTQRFPRGGGMEQLDAGSPESTARQFREAVSLLLPQGGTRIGNALHAAADLLYQHGHPNNERLVVLVSDGADWSPRGENGTGELTEAIAEPVSLMEHLHRDMGIRVHAIGISTRDMYLRRGYQDRPGYTPRHELLEELVKVGGGDPTSIGGLDVLVDYFSGVGGGITHRVRGPLATRPPGRLDADATRILAQAAVSPATSGAGLSEALEEFGKVTVRLADSARRVFPGPLFRGNAFGRVSGDLRAATDPASLARAVGRLPSLLRPAIPADQHPAAVRDLVALSGNMATAARSQPPDLHALARICGGGPDSVPEMIVLVVRTLTTALGDVCTDLDRMPAHRPTAVDPDPGRPATTPVMPAQRDTATDVGAGFVYRD